MMSLSKKIMKNEKIDTIEKADLFMDKVCDGLSNEKLKQAYLDSIKKHLKKQRKGSEYVMLYFKKKCKERGLIDE